jgi:ATP-dependent Lon protease
VTANLLETIPAALRDRLEIIRMGGYTRVEKLTIANEHLVPRAIRENGLKPDHVRFTAGGLERIIDGHTREAGLRELERNLSKVCRKVATRFVEGDTAPVRVGRQRVAELLGPERYRPDLAGRRAEIAVTGRLGEVMRESAQAALSYVRTHCEEYDIEPSAFTESDVHVHFPEGATPKDGPSAGVAIATCLASLFTGRSVRHDLAMTGEITLKGRVLEVGGIKEKLLAAHRAGIRQVLIPKDNLKDLEDVPKEIKNDLEIMGTEDVEHNICEALLSIIVPDKAPMSDVETEPQPMQVRKR